MTGFCSWAHVSVRLRHQTGSLQRAGDMAGAVMTDDTLSPSVRVWSSPFQAPAHSCLEDAYHGLDPVAGSVQRGPSEARVKCSTVV